MGETAGDKIAYVDELAQFDQASIALGQVGLRSENASVRALAQQLIDNHTRHLSSLGDWARGRLAELGTVQLGSEQGVGGSGSDPALEGLTRKLDEYADRSAEREGKALEKYRRLESRSGEEFDREFARIATKSQNHGRDLVQQGMERYAQDVSFAALLRNTGQTLEQHIDQAEGLEKSLK